MFKTAFVYDWPSEQQQWQTLIDLPLTPESLPDWMKLWDVLERSIMEHRARLHWNGMADVTSKAALEAQQHFNNEILPEVMQMQKQVYQLWVDFCKVHPQAGWEVSTRYLQDLQEEQAQIPDLLQQEENLIAAYYNTSHLEQPIPEPYTSVDEMQALMDSEDFAERKAAMDAWQVYLQPARTHRAQVYLQLVELRKMQARKLGLPSPIELAWRRLKRHDFTLLQWQETREAILEHAPALLETLYRWKAQALGLPECTVYEARHPKFSQISQKYSAEHLEALHDGTRAIFQQFSPEMATLYTELLEEGYLDLEKRNSKTSQMFTDMLPVTGKPCMMISMDTDAGMFSIFFHELGHVYHFQEMLKNHHSMLLEPSYKFMEFVAHTFEVLGVHFADHSHLFDAEELQVLRLDTLYYRISVMLNTAVKDLFEEWIYTQPEQTTLEQAEAHWLHLHRQYLHMVPDFDFPAWRASMWCHGWQVRVPFGVTRYALADLCTLEFTEQILQDPQRAFDRLKESMRLGGTVPFLNLIGNCGLSFDFSEASVKRALEGFDRLASAWQLSEAVSVGS